MGVKVTCNYRITKIEEVQVPVFSGDCRTETEKTEKKLRLSLEYEYSSTVNAGRRGDGSRQVEHMLVDQIFIEHGTLPVTEVFDDLREESSNKGLVDLQK